ERLRHAAALHAPRPAEQGVGRIARPRLGPLPRAAHDRRGGRRSRRRSLDQRKERMMAKYVYLYTGGGMPESEEEGARLMKQWQDFLGGLGSRLIDQGAPFG